MRDRVTTVAEIAGAACIIIGAATLSAAAGWIIGGAMGFLFSWRASR